MTKTTFFLLNNNQRFFLRDHTGETDSDPVVLRKVDVDTYKKTGRRGSRTFVNVLDPNMEVWVEIEA